MTWKSRGPVRPGSAQRKTSAPLRRSASCTASNTSGATRFRDRNTLAPAKVAALRALEEPVGTGPWDGVIGRAAETTRRGGGFGAAGAGTGGEAGDFRREELEFCHV